MKKATDFIVEKRNIILIIFIILTGISIFTATKVNINSDISKYLPKTSETKIGKDIMEKEFEEIKEGTLNVMFKNLSNEQKQEKLKVIKEIQGIDNVEYDESEEYNKGSHTLYKIKVKDYAGSETSKNVYEKINKMKPEAISGTIYDKFKPVLQIWIIVLAITMAMIILTILSDSYIEPWLYLFSIGIAVFINKGTNKMFQSVSNITDSITAILQLALSMDYSIMLSNRYKQERKIESDKLKAMKSALYDSFKAISSSSITTVVGLLALVFMSFTIGKDLGFVLAKGVFLSLVSIFLCLPALLLIFDNRIMNSKKKSIEFNLRKLGTFSYKTRWFQLIFIIIFIVAYLLKGNVGILYTDSQKDEIGKVFSTTNQIAIVYKNEYEDQISQYARELSKDERANQVLAYGTTLNEKLAYNEVNDKLKDLGKEDTKIDDYLLKLIYYNYYNKNTKDSMTLNEFIKFIKSDIYDNKKVSEKIE